MSDVYIEELNKADSLSDDDTVLLHTKTEDLQLTIGMLKTLMTVEKAIKLAIPFLVSITGDAIGNGNTDGRETLTIELSNIKASSLKNNIKINGTEFDGTEGITTERWGTERTVTIGGCERKVNGETDVNFPANEVFSGSGQPYVPTAGGAMTGNLKREINESSYNLFEATTENEESGVSVKIKVGDINANAIIQSLSQPYWHNGVNLKKLLTGDDTYELERRISELESMATQTFKNPYKNKTIIDFGDSILAGWGWKEGTGIIQPLKEKYPDTTWINKAESGANMAVTSNPSHTPIVNQVTSYTGAADAIILDGGVNDKNNGLPIGSIETNYDASYNTSTFCGALESSLQYIMDRYPLAVKLYIIPHSFAKDNSYVDSIYSKAIEICDKWNMPYLDMRKYSQIAMTSKNKSKYTYNPNSKKGDGVHPNETWYRTFYCPVIDQALQYQGIGSITASEAPEIVAVTGVKLDQTTLTLNAGDSAQLTATVSPSNATNKSVTWSANNSNVSVSGGKVTAKTVGLAVVTVTTADGGYTAQCNVNVKQTETEVVSDGVVIPDMYNTGVENSIQLKEINTSSLSGTTRLQVTQQVANNLCDSDGVISNYHFNGIYVDFNKTITQTVTFRNCKFMGDDKIAYAVAVSAYGTDKGIIFENCEFSHYKSAVASGEWKATFDKCYVHDMMQDGIKINRSDIYLKNSYVHSLGIDTTSHADGVQIENNTAEVTVHIYNCRFDQPYTSGNTENAAIFAKCKYANIILDVQKSYATGGNYTIYALGSETAKVSGKIECVVGCSSRYGIANIADGVEQNVVSAGSLLVSTVRNGKLCVTNYTNKERILKIVTDTGEKTVTIPKSPTYDENHTQEFSAYPYNVAVEYPAGASWVKCYENDNLIRTQKLGE